MSTRIPDQDNQARSSNADGDVFFLRRGDATSVDAAPIFTFANDDVRFVNGGTSSTTGDTLTFAIEGENGTLVNSRGGEINAENTAIGVSGSNASISNRGTIDGEFNGVDFANGGTSSGQLNNSGLISSDSRAINIGGDGVEIRNSGTVLGTADQRNGTIYADASADNYRLDNRPSGIVDAGEGNNADGVAFQLGEVVNASINNLGQILGRGEDIDPATSSRAAGVRLFTDLENGATFQGEIRNTGLLSSEATAGISAGLLVEDGVRFNGQIVNGRFGEISGANNGLYIGNSEHDLSIQNGGLISSGSRAVNLDGSGFSFENTGDVLGTGDQRNGTVYADATADEYSISNSRRGLIDAGEGNNGSAISLQTGDVANDTVNGSIDNAGRVVGRGDAIEGNTVGDGVRLFSGNENVTFAGDIVNSGFITASTDSDVAAGISVEDGINLTGRIVNTGTISANEIAIDTREAGGTVNVENNGRIEGDVLLSESDDVFETGGRGSVEGVVDGGGGDDILVGGRQNDVLKGGSGDDQLTGGNRNDTFVFTQLDAPSADTVTDFQNGRDLFDVSDFGFTDVSEIDIAQVGNDTLLSFADDNSALLLETDVTAIDNSDFVFASIV